MYICFAEYRIMPESRALYRKECERLLKENPDVRLYEGTDQPNLFVEIWTANTRENAETIKKERCSERSLWSRLTPYIAGGAEKLHVWTFAPVQKGWIAGLPDEE